MEYMLDMRFCLYFVSSSHMSLIFITDRIKERTIFKSILSLNFQEKIEKKKEHSLDIFVSNMGNVNSNIVHRLKSTPLNYRKNQIQQQQRNKHVKYSHDTL